MGNEQVGPIDNTKKYLTRYGVTMSKLLNSSFFGDAYDTRTAYSLDDIGRFHSQGFGMARPDIDTWNMVKLGIIPDMMELSIRISRLESAINTPADQPIEAKKPTKTNKKK